MNVPRPGPSLPPARQGCSSRVHEARAGVRIAPVMARRMLLVASIVAFTVSGWAPVGAGAATPRPADVRCGSFVADDGVRVDVRRSRGASCTTARRVMTQFWTGRKVVHYANGEQCTACTSYTLPGLPGWRCGTGAGLGNAGSAACTKRRASVTGDGYT